ncbi:MAG TPA: hypothetical protein VFO77_08395, partial [Actinoplanes sp.]|nr:hypothetical protein [Actinoplanes sp.]
SRPLAVAPGGPDGGLLAVAARLPTPDWLPEHDLDTGTAATLRAAAPVPADIVSTPPWRRLRTAADLATLNPATPGWDVTRALLGG